MKNNDKRPVEDRIAAMQASLKKLSPCLLPSAKQYCDDAIFQLRIYEEVKYPYKDDKYFAKRLTEAEKAVQDLEVAFYDGSDPARTIKLAQKVYNKVYMLTVIPEIKETDPENVGIRNSFKNDGELNAEGSTVAVEVYDKSIPVVDSFVTTGNGKTNLKGSHIKIRIGNPPAERRATQDAEAEQEDLEKLLVDGETITKWVNLIAPLFSLVMIFLFGFKVIPNFFPGDGGDALFSFLGSAVTMVVSSAAILIAHLVNVRRKGYYYAAMRRKYGNEGFRSFVARNFPGGKEQDGKEKE